MLYDQIASNRRKSLLIVVFFVLFLFAVVWAFSFLLGLGTFGYALAFILAIVITILNYFASESIVLAVSSVRPASEKEFKFLHNTVEGIAIAAGVPKPKLYVIDDTAPNAFATGRDPRHSSIVVTTGLLQKLKRDELEAVLAHEMSHVRNQDVRYMTLITVMAAFIVLLADIVLRSRINSRDAGKAGAVLLVVALVLAILAPIVAQLVKFAASRRREFLADADGALLVRNPDALARALIKVSRDKEALEAANRATAHLYFENPFKGSGGFLDHLFSTHPPVEARVKALTDMPIEYFKTGVQKLP